MPVGGAQCELGVFGRMPQREAGDEPAVEHRSALCERVIRTHWPVSKGLEEEVWVEADCFTECEGFRHPFDEHGQPVIEARA